MAEPQDALEIRHTYRPDGLGTREPVSPDAILAFTRVQWVKQSKILNDPPKWWFIFMTERADGVLGRWREYAANGHGDNPAMIPLAKLHPAYPQRYQFSLLQVLSPTASPAEVSAIEEHFKRALLSKRFGMNKN